MEGDRGGPGDGGVLVSCCWVECRAKFSVRGYFPPPCLFTTLPHLPITSPPAACLSAARKDRKNTPNRIAAHVKTPVEFFAKYLFEAGSSL